MCLNYVYICNMVILVRYKGRMMHIEEVLAGCGRLNVSAEVFIKIDGTIMPIEDFLDGVTASDDKTTARKALKVIEGHLDAAAKHGQFLYEHRN